MAQISNFNAIRSLKEKKSILNGIKRALQSGTFNWVGQQAKQFPSQLFRIDKLQWDDQNWWDCVGITKMDLSNNSIKCIPQQITLFIDLQYLRLANNSLQQIPAILSQLLLFKVLDVAHNCLQCIPKELSSFPALVSLNLSDNTITEMPDLSSIATLELVSLSNNRLVGLPKFGVGLKRLDANNNQIPFVRAAVFQLCKNLEQLSLNKNQIQGIQENSFRQLGSLVTLEIKENKLIQFREVPISDKLDTISLAFNRLTAYEGFKECPNVTVLILADNKLKELSKGVGSLRKLKTLDVSNNDLGDLPSEMGFLKDLVRVQLEGNPLKCIRQSIRAAGTNVLKKYLQDRVDPAIRASLENPSTFQSIDPNQKWSRLINQFSLNGELSLRNLQLQSLDNLVYEQKLKLLNVSNNKITVLSENIANLRSLKTLIVNANQLQKLPFSLGSLPNLETIQANNNAIYTFQVNNNASYLLLNYLDFSVNRLKSVPKAILMLPRLRTLRLSYNQLYSIEQLFNPNVLKTLQILDVSNNKLEQISESVFEKPALNYLNIENNNINKLPTVMGFMKLSGLKVDGNPLKLIKRQIIEKGTVALLQWLRTKHQGQLPVQKQKQKSPPKVVYQVQNCPYQQEPVIKKQKYAQKEGDRDKLIEIQSMIKQIQMEIENNLSLNTMQKNQKKKKIQILMIQRNKINKY